VISRRKEIRKGPEFLDSAREETYTAKKRSLEFLVILLISGAILGPIVGIIAYNGGIYSFFIVLFFISIPILGIEFLVLTFFSVKWFIKSRRLKSLLKVIYSKQNTQDN